MPFAPRIRKDILKALDDYIIPALQSQQVIQILAAPPFDFSAVEHWTVQKKHLRDKSQEYLQMLRHWPDKHLLALRTPTFGFIYQGISHQTIGVTESMADALKKDGSAVSPGISGLRMPAPSIICYESHIPHNDGSAKTTKQPALSRVLAFHIMGDDVLPFLHEHTPQQDTVSHLLQINDPLLSQMAYIYLDELRQPKNARAAQTMLLAFMYRLRRLIITRQPQVANSAWISPENNFNQPPTVTEQKNREVYLQVMDYVQTHLHTDLTLENLAAQFGISSVHLNRIFHQVSGISVMRQVTHQRINTAKEILKTTPERVSDVAKLVGFSRTSSFCAAFRKHVGSSPSEFRKQ